MGKTKRRRASIVRDRLFDPGIKVCRAPGMGNYMFNRSSLEESRPTATVVKENKEGGRHVRGEEDVAGDRQGGVKNQLEG